MVVAAVILAAFLFRLGVGLAQSQQLWQQGDVSYYQIAENLARSGEFALTAGEPTRWRNPVYPAFLAAVFFAFGKSTVAFVTANILINTLVVAASYFLGARLFDRKVGIVAAILVGMYPYLVWQSGHIIETGMVSLLLLGLVFAILMASDTGDSRWAITAGLFGGLGVLTKAVVLPFVVLTVIWWALRVRGRGRARAPALLLFVLTVGLTMLPWVVRNASVEGTPSITESNGELNLWKGNNSLTFKIYPAFSLDSLWPYEQAALSSTATSKAERNAWYLARVREYVREQPIAFLEGLIRKGSLLYHWEMVPYSGVNAEIDPATGSIISVGQARSLFERVLYTVPYLFAVLLGLFGVYRSLATHKASILLVGLLYVSWTAVHALVFAYSRYRMAVEPFLLIWAAFGLVQLADGYLATQQRRSLARNHAGRSESSAG